MKIGLTSDFNFVFSFGNYRGLAFGNLFVLARRYQELEDFFLFPWFISSRSSAVPSPTSPNKCN
jgi:hypothetical protein